MCNNHVHIRGLQTSTRLTSRSQIKQAAGQEATGQVNDRAEGYIPRSQAVDTRQEVTSGAKDYLTIEVNKVDVGTESTASVFTAPLL